MMLYSPFPDISFQELDIHHYILDNPKYPTDPKAVALIDEPSGRVVTRGELINGAKRLSHALIQEYAWKDGDVAAIFLSNSTLYPAIFLGILGSGGVVTTSNNHYTAKELQHQLSHSDAKLLFTSIELLPIALEAAKASHLPPSRIILTDAQGKTKGLPEGSKSLEQVLSSIPELPATAQWPCELSPEQVKSRTALIAYSSGTSGMPKGIELTHRNITCNIQQYIAFEGPAPKDDVWIEFLPLYHIYGLITSLFTALTLQIPMVIMPRFSLVPLLEAITRYNVTFMHVVPPIVLAFAKSPEVDRYDLSKVRGMMSAAAPLDAELGETVTSRTGIQVRQVYGMSETSPLTVMSPAVSPKAGTIGIILPNVEVSIRRPDGSPAGTGEEGELFVRGPNNMKGYLKNPKATSETIDANGFLRTGDVVALHPSGHLMVVDRLKELIKYKGFQVAPAELEAVLLSHPDIDDVAVIGVHSREQATELPRAYVVPRKGSSLKEDHVHDHVRCRLAQHKHLRGGVVFIEAIPKSPAGKILRRLLRDTLPTSPSALNPVPSRL